MSSEETPVSVSASKRGDLVTFEFRGFRVTGRVRRVLKNGTRTIEVTEADPGFERHMAQSIDEGIMVDVRHGGVNMRSSEETPASKVIRYVREELADMPPGSKITDAARRVKTKFPTLCLQCMEQIGSWPSSERELNALQQVWP